MLLKRFNTDDWTEIRKDHCSSKQLGLSHDGSVLDLVAKFDRQINENSNLEKLMHRNILTDVPPIL